MRVLDLTQKMEEGMPVYPGDPLFQTRIAADHETDGYRVASLSFGSHTGTHLDAPFHFFQDGEPLDSFPLSLFQSSAAAIDLTAKLGAYQYGTLPPLILPDLLIPFRPVFDEAETVILKTGWSAQFGAAGFFEAFPSFLPETADWIAETPIRILGLETPSLSALAEHDPGDGPVPVSEYSLRPANIQLFLHADAESHRILLGRTPPILLLENLRCPDQLPAVTESDLHGSWRAKLFTLLSFPLSFSQADASPVRAAAVLP